jgi:hypothetical protein
MDLRDAIQRGALEGPSYGRPRITAELRRRGWKVNPKRVYRSMRADNLLCVWKRKLVVATDSNHDRQVYPNLAGEMVLTGIDQLWPISLTLRQALELRQPAPGVAQHSESRNSSTKFITRSGCPRRWGTGRRWSSNTCWGRRVGWRGAQDPHTQGGGERESRAVDSAAQGVVGVAVAAGNVGAGEAENFLRLGGSPTLPQRGHARGRAWWRWLSAARDPGRGECNRCSGGRRRAAHRRRNLHGCARAGTGLWPRFPTARKSKAVPQGNAWRVWWRIKRTR